MFGVLWLSLTWSFVAAKCLPVAPFAAMAALPASVVASDSEPADSRSRAVASEPAAEPVHFIRPLGVANDDILRQFNLSKESIEAQSRMIKNRMSNPVNAGQTRQSSHHQRRLHNSSVSWTTQQELRDRSGHSKGNRAAGIRMQEVYRTIMNFVEMNGRPASPTNTTLLQQGEQVAEMLSSDGAIGVNVGRVRYLQPSCEVPKHADEDSWNSPGSLHLYFDVSGIQPREGYQLHLTSAKLRLMKYAEGKAQSSDDCPESSGNRDNPAARRLAVNERSGPGPFFFAGPSDEEKIRISVHNFTRPLKRHRGHKKKLLDSQMALTKEEGFMELDVKLAVRWWLVPNGRNLGLVVEVEDTEGQRKSPLSFFKQRNCTAVHSEEEESDYANLTTPVLELTVLEIPEGRSLTELGTGVAAVVSPSSGEKRKRPAATEENQHEDASANDDEEVGLGRHHRHRPDHHVQYEEQADDANRIQYAKRASTSTSHLRSGSNNHGRSKSNRRGSSLASRILPAVPTLATLEDHDLLENSDQQLDDESRESQGARHQQQADAPIYYQSPHDFFMQKVLDARANQQAASNPSHHHHHPRKENRRTQS